MVTLVEQRREMRANCLPNTKANKMNMSSKVDRKSEGGIVASALILSEAPLIERSQKRSWPQFSQPSRVAQAALWVVGAVCLFGGAGGEAVAQTDALVIVSISPTSAAAGDSAATTSDVALVLNAGDTNGGIGEVFTVVFGAFGN